MSLLRSAILSAMLVIAASYSPLSLADHHPYAVGILEGTESQVNRQVIDLIRKQDFKQLREMFAKGVRVNVADNKGGRPIHFAAFMGSVEAVKVLADLGADLKATTFGGWTTLHYAAYGGHSQVADFLIKAGIPVDVPDSGGESPLYYAIETGNLVMTEWLISHGADINHENYKGETPLDTALGTPHKQLVEYLKKRGAKAGDPN